MQVAERTRRREAARYIVGDDEDETGHDVPVRGNKKTSSRI
jgi:hypothetical protein